MPTDVVQIGSFIISKVVFDAFIIILSVVSGGLVTYFTTRAIENQKWIQQKKDKQQEQYREAIALALEWIAPIDNALIHVQSLSAAYMNNRIIRGEFQKRWPRLLNELGALDRAMPARLKVLLPQKFYEGFDIVNDIDDLYFYLLRTLEETPISDGAFAEMVKNATDQIIFIKKSSENYKSMLINEYKNSYH